MNMDGDGRNEVIQKTIQKRFRRLKFFKNLVKRKVHTFDVPHQTKEDDINVSNLRGRCLCSFGEREC